jgi:hypothetical protein
MIPSALPYLVVYLGSAKFAACYPFSVGGGSWEAALRRGVASRERQSISPATPLVAASLPPKLQTRARTLGAELTHRDRAAKTVVYVASGGTWPGDIGPCVVEVVPFASEPYVQGLVVRLTVDQALGVIFDMREIHVPILPLAQRLSYESFDYVACECLGILPIKEQIPPDVLRDRERRASKQGGFAGRRYGARDEHVGPQISAAIDSRKDPVDS